MRRIVGFVTRVTAFRIGLAIGLFFAALHVLQVATRAEIPLLTRMESALVDLRFRLRAQVHPPQPSGQVIIAAVDEAAIARYGRFPWDRRVIVSLIDKLAAEKAQAIGFDISFSDEDLGAKFAGAKRYRKLFEQVNLAAPQYKPTVDGFDEAEADVAGAGSALRSLAGKVKPDGQLLYETAKSRLDDGGEKLSAARKELDALVERDAQFAADLDRDLEGVDPDSLLGAAIARAPDKVVIGWIALTRGELVGDGKEHLERIAPAHLHAPEYREAQSDGTERVIPVERTWIKEYEGLRAPLAPVARGTKWFGFFNTLPDADGTIRHAALAVQIGGQIFPSLDAAVLAISLGVKAQDITPVTSNARDGELLGFDFGGKRFVPTDPRGLIEINYFGKFPPVSIADIMDGKLDGKLAGKLVLVGATAQGTFDQRVTPLDRITAGIQTHANAIETMLTQKYLLRGPVLQALEVLVLLLLAFLFAFVFARVRVQLALPAAAASALGILTFSSLLFAFGYDVFTALPLLELLAMFVLVTIYRYATEERDKRQLRKAFQLYLNPEVMEEMLDAPENLQLGGKELEMTVMFSDIRGFTSISEKLTPQALVHLLNEYLSPMTDIVFEKRGTLDKYIGDAVMAFFGAPVQTPQHAQNGCDAALAMMESLERLREKWRIESPDIPHVDIGIGLNSGPMVVGNMGSLQRFNYTVMGDNVNLASRLEGLNKEYGTHILISEQTLNAAGRTYGVRELDSVRVKGKKEPVVLFELRSKAPKADDAQLLNDYAAGLALYRAGRFSEARAIFDQHPHDGPSALMSSRCAAMAQAAPPAAWDGVFQMEHK